jgi:hypothetical protein
METYVTPICYLPRQCLSPLFGSCEALFDGIQKHCIFQSGSYPLFIVQLLIDCADVDSCS